VAGLAGVGVSASGTSAASALAGPANTSRVPDSRHLYRWYPPAWMSEYLRPLFCGDGVIGGNSGMPNAGHTSVHLTGESRGHVCAGESAMKTSMVMWW
jgi:hypothetical protein